MVLSANQSTTVRIDDKEYLYFGGTNYLGLAHRRELFEASQRAFHQYGFSSGASRVTSGENEELLSLEAELADFVLADNAIVVPAGFLANQLVVDSLEEEIDVWITGKQPHASIVSALRLSRKPAMAIEFDSLQQHLPLREKLGLSKDARIAMFAEPIDPLPGRLIDVGALWAALGNSGYLILDEAHSLGVLGINGRGALEQFNLPAHAPRLIRTGTFSKAFGAYGGFVVAGTSVVNEMKERAAAFKGSTSLPPLVCAAAREALRLLVSDRRETIERLHANIQYLNDQLGQLCGKSAELPVFEPAASPIFYLPSAPCVSRARELLFERDIYIPTIASYFGDLCAIGLRWTIQAAHSRAELKKLVDTIGECL
jgi:8-amino-7-oxononanoate synthase